MTGAALKLDRSVPVWGVVCGLAVSVMTGAGMVWNLSGIAHDVGEVKVALMTMQAREDTRDARVTALEARMVKLETSVGFLEKLR